MVTCGSVNSIHNSFTLYCDCCDATKPGRRVQPDAGTRRYSTGREHKKTPRDGPVAFFVGVAGVVPAELDQSDFRTPVTRSPSPLSWIDTFSPFWIEGTATSRGIV